MAANPYGFSLGEVYRDIEGIKGARQVNQLNQMKIDEVKASQKRNALLPEAREQAMTGDIDAQKTLLALDPENGPKFIEAVAGMDDRQREATKRAIDEMGRMAFYVDQGKTDEEKAARYQRVLQEVSPDVRSRMPQQYDPREIELALMKASSMDQILENPKAIRVGEEDIVYKGGKEIARGTRAPTGKADGRTFKASDENLVYKQFVELEGGIFDEKGNIRGLNNKSQMRAQARTAEAMKLLQDSPELSLSEAVAIIARQSGSQLPTMNQMAPASNPNDPVSIRNFFIPQ